MHYPSSEIKISPKRNFWRDRVSFLETFLISTIAVIILYLFFTRLNMYNEINLKNIKDHGSYTMVYSNVIALSISIILGLCVMAYIIKRAKEEKLYEVSFLISNKNDEYMTYILPDILAPICIDGYSLKVDNTNNGFLSIYVPNKSPERVKYVLETLRENDINAQRDTSSEGNIFASEYK